jgi:hypothetical protein
MVSSGNMADMAEADRGHAGFGIIHPEHQEAIAERRAHRAVAVERDQRARLRDDRVAAL